MSSISMDAPTLQATRNNMRNFINFVHMHEFLLKQYGAIKIVPPSEFQEVFKKNRIKCILPSTIQQITQPNRNNMIYSVDTVPCINENKLKQLLPLNETTFWLSLSQSSNKQQISSVSILSNMSFFLKRVSRTDFDIHRLPQRSLLALCDSKCLRQFVPSLIRAHGPGAIHPLASAHQRLFSFDYHHGGGLRYWYIVPASERGALEHMFQQEAISLCLEHGQVLIDPLTFDKYRIRYHRLVQHPNEIVVLAAGALSQSFTEDATWSETIDFALPSWLDDGHASAQISCACKLPITSLSKVIDINSFRPELIQCYINTYLNIIIDSKSLSNTSNQNSETNKISILSSTSLTSLDRSSSQSVISSIGSNLFEDEGIDNCHYLNQLKMQEENNVLEIPDEFAHCTTSYSLQTSSKSTDDFYEIFSSQDSYERTMIESIDDPCTLSFEEIMDLLSTPPIPVKSIESQAEPQVDKRNDNKRTISVSSVTYFSLKKN
ncbi:unnamed protein product [Rotaria sordida]|uniref:Uncharacterized protein n=1 Tax=Rotaria sordida TaxID=392033 RepID=A0A819MTC3_9BILA|nr:unnamed protein product [Rotaria sordida]CAF0927037.1 unnamed protein product [Rotaria sordida]CAF0978919.1 unnamed protein product [Rotaria sordida]CAF3985757.1 unnamed protein product [Rotaria sordida]